MSFSRCQGGRESPVKWASYMTGMAPPRPRTDWCPGIALGDVMRAVVLGEVVENLLRQLR